MTSEKCIISMCVRGIDFVSVSTIFRLDFVIVQTMWYFFVFPFTAISVSCSWTGSFTAISVSCSWSGSFTAIGVSCSWTMALLQL